MLRTFPRSVTALQAPTVFASGAYPHQMRIWMGTLAVTALAVAYLAFALALVAGAAVTSAAVVGGRRQRRVAASQPTAAPDLPRA